MNNLVKEFIKFCIGKGIDATEERIKINVGVLLRNGNTEEQVSMALDRLFLKTPFFPDASMIIKEIEGDVKQDTSDQAILDATKVLEAARTYSAYDPLEAEKFLGQELYAKAINFMSWSEWTLLKISEVPTVKAQLREYLKAKKNTDLKQIESGRDNKLINNKEYLL